METEFKQSRSVADISANPGDPQASEWEIALSFPDAEESVFYQGNFRLEYVFRDSTGELISRDPLLLSSSLDHAEISFSNNLGASIQLSPAGADFITRTIRAHIALGQLATTVDFILKATIPVLPQGNTFSSDNITADKLNEEFRRLSLQAKFAEEQIAGDQEFLSKDFSNLGADIPQETREGVLDALGVPGAHNLLRTDLSNLPDSLTSAEQTSIRNKLGLGVVPDSVSTDQASMGINVRGPNSRPTQYNGNDLHFTFTQHELKDMGVSQIRIDNNIGENRYFLYISDELRTIDSLDQLHSDAVWPDDVKCRARGAVATQEYHQNAPRHRR